MNYMALITSIFLLSGVVEAEGVKDKGAYVGGALGATKFDDDDAFSGLIFDDEDTSLLIYGGYKFLRYLSVEGRVIGFGEFSISDQITTITFNARAITANAVGNLPLGGTRWELFGQLGLGIISMNIDGGSIEHETVGSVGIGIRFTPIEHFSIALQTDAYAWENDSLGAAFDMSMAATQIAFQYNF